MRLTTKGRYAVTAMLDVALNSQKGPVNLGDISRRQGISLSYLEQLFARLRKQGLVKSIRGPGGGYCLDTSTSELTVLAIIDAVNESVDATQCKQKGNCKEGEICLTHHLWMDLSEQIRDFLNQVSLEDLIKKRNPADSSSEIDDNAEITLLKLPS